MARRSPAPNRATVNLARENPEGRGCLGRSRCRSEAADLNAFRDRVRSDKRRRDDLLQLPGEVRHQVDTRILVWMRNPKHRVQAEYQIGELIVVMRVDDSFRRTHPAVGGAQVKLTLNGVDCLHERMAFAAVAVFAQSRVLE